MAFLPHHPAQGEEEPQKIDPAKLKALTLTQILPVVYHDKSGKLQEIYFEDSASADAWLDPALRQISHSLFPFLFHNCGKET